MGLFPWRGRIEVKERVHVDRTSHRSIAIAIAFVFARGAMAVDLDAWIATVRGCQHLEEDQLKSLCEYVRGTSVEAREGKAWTAKADVETHARDACR